MDYKEQNFISAVIYVHNAENRIEEFLRSIIAVLENNFEHSEIICVNDCSDDNSVKRIREASTVAKTTSVSILNMSYFHGLELAMNAGVDLAIGDFVYEFDSTFMEYQAEEIVRVYQRALEGYDIVSASADKGQKITSRIFYYLFDRFATLSYKMTTESFRILSRRVINRVSSMNKSIPYRKAIYANCGLRTDNLIYEVHKKEEIVDRKEQRYRMRLAVDSLILFTDVGYRFSITMTIVMMVITVMMSLYSLFTYIISTPVEGWTTTILFLSVAFFGVFGTLTIVVKYLQLLVELVYKRKNYNFESIEKLTK